MLLKAETYVTVDGGKNFKDLELGGEIMCPYYDASRKCCKLYDTYQEDYQIQAYCTSGEWGKCANYEAYNK
ncbi:MAG: hypothetical protein LBD23_12445 [Oscillospiraceae bacterium]|jgi:hypothetical protein|nr:hypothetical protein [Oscillospiraceae bacterium]